MKKVEYSQLVQRKLLKLKAELVGEYGEQKAKEILTEMADHADMLGQHKKAVSSVTICNNDLRATELITKR